MATIVLLQHQLREGLDLPLMAHTLAGFWRERGHRVVEHFGLDKPPPGDVAIMHLDLTVIPAGYRELVARYPRVINGAALDMSRRHFSRDLVRPGTGWNGRVIVKTDTNYQGKPEFLMHAVASDLGIECDVADGPVMDEYRIYARPGDVPDWIWRAPGLIVERFVPEQDARGYVLRNWLFFGSREHSYRGWCDRSIMKLRDLRDVEPIPVPDELRAWRDRLELDFASFDYIEQDGRCMLLDVNKTPGLGETSRKRLAPVLGSIAAGVEDFL